jgi:hypothetical protein
MPSLVLGLDTTFLTLDADPMLVLNLVVAFLSFDPLLGLNAAFLTLDADPVPAFLTLDLPSLSRSLPFLSPFPFLVSSQIICFSVCS